MLDKANTIEARRAANRIGLIARRSRRHNDNLGGFNVWLERGRYLFRSGPNGSTVFDTWKWTGEPLQRRRA